jgi:hypothetical protein
MLKKVVKSGKKKWESGPADSDHHLKMEYSQSYRKLISEGWKEKEAIALIKIRHRIPDSDQPRYLTNEERAEKFHLLIFSGSLVYLFLYYLLNSTSKIFLTMLQYLENDPVKNFSWLRWYIYSFYLLLIFFTISLYIKDMNLLDRLKELNFLKLRRMFFLTVVLGVVNCFFGAISKRSLGNIYELKVKLSDIIIFSDLVFPIVISLCFFALFTKYYGEQING